MNRDSGIEIPEAWMPTIKIHNNRRAAKKAAAERTTHQNSEDRNAPIKAFLKPGNLVISTTGKLKM